MLTKRLIVVVKDFTSYYTYIFKVTKIPALPDLESCSSKGIKKKKSFCRKLYKNRRLNDFGKQIDYTYHIGTCT